MQTLPKSYSFPRIKKHQRAFSLVELTIVLLIAGLLVSGMVTGFTRFVAQARVKQVQADLRAIEEALFGYVIVNGYFPCPDMDNFPPYVVPPPPPPPDGQENRVGNICANNLSGNNLIGFLPATDLGVPAIDPWGSRYLYAVAPEYSDIPGGPVTFSIGPPAGIVFDIRNTNPAEPNSNIIATNVIVFIFSAGPNLSFPLGVPGSNDEQENMNFDTVFVSKEYTPPGSPLAYDDITRWISLPSLINKMVDAQRLP